MDTPKDSVQRDAPNFAAWNLDTLARFATDAYHTMKAQAEAMEQLRQDVRDAMALARKANR